MFLGQRMLDELNRALLIVGLICAILGSLLFENLRWLRLTLSLVAAVCLVFAVIRLLGGNESRRYRENQRYLTLTTGARTFFSKIRGWFSRVFAKKTPGERPKRAAKARKNPTWSEIRQYKYFICPQCTQRLRVPRGKGKLRVTCTRCGNVFQVKS